MKTSAAAADDEQMNRFSFKLIAIRVIGIS